MSIVSYIESPRLVWIRRKDMWLGKIRLLVAPKDVSPQLIINRETYADEAALFMSLAINQYLVQVFYFFPIYHFHWFILSSPTSFIKLLNLFYPIITCYFRPAVLVVIILIDEYSPTNSISISFMTLLIWNLPTCLKLNFLFFKK